MMMRMMKLSLLFLLAAGTRGAVPTSRRDKTLAADASRRRLTTAATSSTSAIRLNLGSDFASLDGSLVTFEPQSFLGIGTVFEVTTTRPIVNVEPGYPESIYKTMVQNDFAFTYSIPVPDGTKAVRLRLHFCEITDFKPLARTFNVAVEGEQILSELDVATVSGNYRAHVEETGDIPIDDGVVDVEFIPVQDYAMISGIEVIPVQSEPIRLNGGSNESLSSFGENAVVFEGDGAIMEFLSSGEVAAESLAPQSITLRDAASSYPEELYQTRVAGNSFGLSFPVGGDATRMDILLHFCDDQPPGTRLFSVEVNDDLVIPSLDVSQEANGAYHALVRRVRVFVDPAKLEVQIRFLASTEGALDAAILSGIEIVPVDPKEPIRVNIGSYETLDTGGDDFIFGSPAHFLFDHDESAMPVKGFNDLRHFYNRATDPSPWNFANFSFQELNVSLPDNATIPEGIPAKLFDSLAYSHAFRCSVPLPELVDWSSVNLRLHFRRPDGIRRPNGWPIDDVTSVHMLDNVVFSGRLGVRELITRKTLRVKDDSIPASFDESRFLWEGNVQVNTGSTLYLFLTAPATSYYRDAILSGLEIVPIGSTRQTAAATFTLMPPPIRLYEGSTPPGADWLPASDYRSDQMGSGRTITHEDYPLTYTQIDSFYDPVLYTDSCINILSTEFDYIKYSIPLPFEVRELEVRLHLPEVPKDNYDIRVNNGWKVSVDGNVALLLTNFQTMLPDEFSVPETADTINPIVVKADDDMLEIELSVGPAPWGCRFAFCGLEIYPFSSQVIRVSPAGSEKSNFYGPVPFYSAIPSLSNPDLGTAWIEWVAVEADAYANKTLYSRYNNTSWEEFVDGLLWDRFVGTWELAPTEGLIQHYPGADDNPASLANEQWSTVYSESMMTSFMACMEFSTEFSFDFAAPKGVEFVRVRLFFVEMLQVYLGKRKFHVEINGVRVLTDFTMQIADWPAYSLIIEEFPLATDGRDSINIKFVTPAPDETLFAQELNGQPFATVFDTHDKWLDIFGDTVQGPTPFGLGPFSPLYDWHPFGVHKPTAQINGIEILPLGSQAFAYGIRINSGGRGFARDLLSDAFFSGSDDLDVMTDGTEATGPMNTLRRGTTIQYAIPVDASVTTVFVRLGFIELDDSIQAGDRLCDISIEGEPVQLAYDVFAEAGGNRKEVHFHEFISLKPNNLLVDIALNSTDGATPCIISTVEVIPFDEFISDGLLLDCGQESSPLAGPSYPFGNAFGMQPNVFENSTGALQLSSVASAYQSRLAIKNVPLEVPHRVYNSMVYGQDFCYKFQLPSDHVRFILHLADICFDEENVESRVYDTSCGIRKMNVYLQDEMVLESFSGAPLTAYSKAFDRKVPDRVVEIRFESLNKENEFEYAFVNAIEVINLMPFTLDAGSSSYGDRLAVGHYLLNTQEPRQWATQKDILNLKKGYPMSFYQTLYGSKDFTYLLGCQPEAALIRFHFCDITELSTIRRQRIYIDGAIVLDDFDPVEAALEEYGRETNQGAASLTRVAYYWDHLHVRRRGERKVRVRIESQVPGVQAILSGIQIIPLFDNRVSTFGVANKMKNLGTQNVVGMRGESAITTDFIQRFNVPVSATHALIMIKFKEIYRDEGVHDCDEHKSRVNSIYVSGEQVLTDLNVCQQAGGYGKTFVWQGSAAAGEDGTIRIVTMSNRPYEYPIVDEIEAYSHYIWNDDGDLMLFARGQDEDDQDDATSA